MVSKSGGDISAELLKGLADPIGCPKDSIKLDVRYTDRLTDAFGYGSLASTWWPTNDNTATYSWHLTIYRITATNRG